MLEHPEEEREHAERSGSRVVEAVHGVESPEEERAENEPPAVARREFQSRQPRRGPFRQSCIVKSERGQRKRHRQHVRV